MAAPQPAEDHINDSLARRFSYKIGADWLQTLRPSVTVKRRKLDAALDIFEAVIQCRISYS